MKTINLIKLNKRSPRKKCGTWETLEKVLKDAGYHQRELEKLKKLTLNFQKDSPKNHSYPSLNCCLPSSSTMLP